MLKNYITIAINNLLKNKLYSAINIIGLAIGLAACIVIGLYVRDQTSYDKQWKDSDRIYRVNFLWQRPGAEPIRSSTTPLPAMQALKEYFKGNFEQTARTFPGQEEITINIGTDRFKSSITSVDPAFIDIFQLKVIAGSLKDTLTNITNIALSEETARRHFGSQDPIGKVITISTLGMKIDFKVTAVYRIPGNTVLDDIPIIVLLDDKLLPQSITHWYYSRYHTYIKLKAGVDIETMKPLLPALIDRNLPSDDPTRKTSDQLSLEFQRLDAAHLDSTWDDSRAGGNKTVVMSFAGISLLVLLIGCINFTILTTAKATQRAREVAMRKVVGAKRKQLIVQFLGESTFIVLLAMILSMGLVELMLPIFESIVGKTLSFNYISLNAILPLLVMLIIVGISGGLYPAFILSGFRPGDTLKANQSKETSGSMSLRYVLVIFQFCISIVLIIATGVIFIQMRYSLNRDPGYNKDNLLIINQMYRDEFRGKIEPLKNELLNLANVSDVSFSGVQPSQIFAYSIGFTHLGRPETEYAFASSAVGYDYFTTYQIPVVSGRNYSVERDLPEPAEAFYVMTATINDNEDKELLESNIILNESAVRQLGFNNTEDAIGKIINSTTYSNTNYTIIGVVADNHIFSINAPPRPTAYLLQPYIIHAVTVRFKGSRHKILEQVKSVWNKVMGDAEISYVFVDQLLAGEFQQEQTEMKVFISFSLLAIVIACMGLFGSASFTVEFRTKEIGLRKVMGARVKNIVTLLLWQFSKPVLIANIIAWPVAIFAMQGWLERFQYRFNPLLLIPICLVSGLIALAIAWFTVAGNTSRVAKSKPIHALRYE
jgi:putative ABC transport system permease protein